MKLPENVKWSNTAEEINRRVNDNFQGRQKYIEVFQDRTKWLSEHMNQDSLVTNYYGFGGIGKSTLLKKLKDTAEKQNIKFVSYEFADNTEYYAKRKTRNEEAKTAFRAELERDDLDGLFMRDIIREEVQPNDSRLR